MWRVCGIDEAGRGPLAGPLVMAGVVLNESIDGLNDSKKLQSSVREKLYLEIVEKSKYHIAIRSAKDIDSFGISKCIASGLSEIVENLSGFNYIFDGNCSFGILGINTLIKADQKIAEVSAASILAKVTRDKIMVDLSREFPNYGFEVHKGYGTKKHIEAIKKFGKCIIHRESFKIREL